MNNRIARHGNGGDTAVRNSFRQYRREGLQGWFRNAATSQPEATANSATLRTTLPLCSETAPQLHFSSTGDTCTLEDGLAVGVAGTPVFRSPELQKIARDEGAASAIACAYRENGSDVFAKIYGAFCVCIADSANDTTLLAIDRLGQFSLYYRATEEGIFFGSEPARCANADAAAGFPTAQGVFNYIYFHMVPSPGTVYPGVSKLAAAHCIEYRGGKATPRCYWVPQFTESTSTASFDELSAELRDVLREALRNSLPAEGKIGAFLSGGLDSSTVTGLMSELERQDAEAYSIGFSAEGYDEMAFARTTAQHFGVKLNEYYVTPEDIVETLPLVATSYDEPFGNSSALPAYFCARMATDNGVSTLLAGDGGDELFGGNERYLRQEVFERYALIPSIVRRGLIEPLAAILPGALPLAGKARSYIEQANTPLPDRMQSYNFLHRHAAEEIFVPELLAEIDRELPLALLRDVYHRPAPASDLNQMLYMDWQFTLADNDLRKVSHMCAVAGVNVTYPMLDDVLVEFSCKVPSQWKIKDGDLRHFFKRALTGWLPDTTINKTKQGFGLPFGVWMRSYAPLREMAYDNLQKLKSRGIVRPDFIDRAIAMHQSEHAAYYGELVWIFTVFELWMDAKTTAGNDLWK